MAQDRNTPSKGDVQIFDGFVWKPMSMVSALLLALVVKVVDSVFSIVDDGDNTKALNFQAGTQATGLTTTIDVGAQTGSRTFTHPVTAGNDTYAVLGTAQIFSAAQTFTGNIAQTGSTTLTTGTGAVLLNGAVTLGATKTLTMSGNANISSAVNANIGYNATVSAAGTTAAAINSCVNDAGNGIYLAAFSTTYSGSALGSVRAGAAELINIGASVVALKIGNNTVNIPIKFGIGSSEIMEIAQTAGTLATSAVTVKSTLAATSATAAAFVSTGGIGTSGNIIGGQGIGLGVSSTVTAAGTTTLTNASRAIQNFTGTTTQTVQFPAANIFGAGVAVRYTIDNHSTGIVTPTRAGADTFKGGGTTFPVAGGASITFVSDGVSVWGVD